MKTEREFLFDIYKALGLEDFAAVKQVVKDRYIELYNFEQDLIEQENRRRPTWWNMTDLPSKDSELMSNTKETIKSMKEE